MRISARKSRRNRGQNRTSVYEAEKGIDKNPSPLFIDVLAVCRQRQEFFTENTPNLLEYAKMFPYQQTGP